jgi:hypothetical protein
MQLTTFTYGPYPAWSVDCLPDLDGPHTLVLVFGAPEFAGNPEPLCELRRAYPHAQVVGCSTAGEILGTTVSDETLSVAVARFDGTELATAVAPVPSDDASYAAGQSLAGSLTRPDLRGVLVLSDGLRVNGSELVRGLRAALPASVVITGGLAGDGDRFGATWVLHGDHVESGRVVAVGFYGDRVRLGHGSKGGWDIFGPERRVTRSSGNRLYELDGQPALELYKTYLGERAAALPASALLFPLAVRADEAPDRQLVRTVLAVDEATQSMTFAGDIPEGSFAQLMRANFDRLIDGAGEAAAMVPLGAVNGGPTLSVAISCVGRRLVLGERTEEELEATLEVLPAGTQQVGFYSYGEISPLATGTCELHNQTMTLTTIAED